MQRNWNWQGWVAIALAGLALMVAIGGRAPWGGQRQMMWAERGSMQMAPQAPQAPQAPNAPGGRSFGRGQDGQGFMPGQGGPRSMMGQHGPGDFRSGPMGMMGRHGHPGIFGMLFGLAKLVGLGLLAWLLLRMFNQRRNDTPATPVPTTPAGHDPRVE